MKSLFVADAVCLTTYDFDAATGEIHACVGLDPKFVDLYSQRYSRCNPWFKNDDWYPSGAVVADRQIVTAGALVHSEFYQAWLEPQGLLHRIAATIARNGSQVTSYELFRRRQATQFGVFDRTDLRQLLPHLQTSSEIHRKLEQMRQERGAALEALDRLSVGVLFVDADAHVLSTNSFAREMMTRPAGLRDGLCGLRAPVDDETDILRSFVREVAVGATVAAEEGLLELSRTEGNPPLRLIACPLRDQDGTAIGEAGRILVLALDPNQTKCLDEQALRERYNLTPAEARLAIAIGSGERLIDAAEKLAVTPNTARTHLKRIFNKTNTSRQTELILLLQANAPSSPKIARY